MRIESLGATLGRQMWSRIRSRSYWVGATAPVLLIGLLLSRPAMPPGVQP